MFQSFLQTFLCFCSTSSVLLLHQTDGFQHYRKLQVSYVPALKMCNVVITIQSSFLLSLTLAQAYLKDSWSGRVLLAVLGLRMQHNIQVDNPGTDSGRVVVPGLFYYFHFKWLPTDIKQAHVNILHFPYHNCWLILFFHTLPVLFYCRNYINQASNVVGASYKRWMCLKTKALSPDANMCLHFLEMYASSGSTKRFFVLVKFST